jgi:hypothetical protein
MKKRSSLATAVLLILIGSWFLAAALFEPVANLAHGLATWPLSIIGAGALIALLGIVFWLPGMMIPAAVVTGIGGLLYWQNATGQWDTWAYAWALIPVFVGVGIILTGLLIRKRGAVIGGGSALFSGAVLFLVFGSLLGGGVQVLQLWPLLLIGLGIILLGGSLRKKKLSEA